MVSVCVPSVSLPASLLQDDVARASTKPAAKIIGLVIICCVYDKSTARENRVCHNIVHLDI
jgi:hypothetical protein